MDDIGITGFLFGNVDEKGRLESDVFDESEKKQLAGLSEMGVGSMLSQLDKESRNCMADVDYAIPPPSPMAVDYSNISGNRF
jgi:transcription initiation factor TFIID subunit 1